MNLPKFCWAHVWRLAIYGQLGRSADAAKTKKELLTLYLSFPENARYEFEKFNVHRELADHVFDGLNKAGLDIPPRTN